MSHWVAILGVGASFFLSAWVLYLQVYDNLETTEPEYLHLDDFRRNPL